MPLLRARTHFAVGHRHVRPGDLVESTDPIVKGREHLFAQPEATNVERATAAPGERRTVSKATKKATGATKKQATKKATGDG